jgi:hypothetical protein
MAREAGNNRVIDFMETVLREHKLTTWREQLGLLPLGRTFAWGVRLFHKFVLHSHASPLLTASRVFGNFT